MARPRGNEWLDEEIHSLKNQKVDILVSLLEQTEINELGLPDEQKFCAEHNITYINFPIKDRDIPRSKNKTNTLVASLQAALDKGSSTVIHCRMGIGRSSLIAATLLLKTGKTTKEIWMHISSIRGLSVPDTTEQSEWLETMRHIHP